MQRLFGHDAERVLANTERLSRGLGQVVRDVVFGTFYARPGLDLKTRQLVTVVGLAALGTCAPQLALHLRAAQQVGWTRQELVEALTQLSIYAGFPAALNALALLETEGGARGETDAR